MARQKTIDTFNRRRIKRCEDFHNIHGDIIKSLIYSGYTINDIFKAGYGSGKPFLNSYIDMYGHRDKIIENTKSKLRLTAQRNGRMAVNTLKGVELKPLNDEIINWYKNAVDSGMYRMDILNALKTKFGYKRVKYNQLVSLYGVGDKNPQCGDSNPFYGKTPSYKSGRGIVSHLINNGKYIICRSYLELKVYLYMQCNNIDFELSEHRIKYTHMNGNKRTYNPDFVRVSKNTIYEIKPKSLIDIPINKLKFDATRQYCKEYNLQFDIITEETYPIYEIQYEYILELIENGNIIISDEQFKRLENSKDEYSKKNTNF